MRQYLQITKSYGRQTVLKRMRMEGDPRKGIVVIIIETQNALDDDSWSEYVRFAMTADQSHLFSHAGGTVGFANSSLPDPVEIRQ